jgi:hypothetical protein
LENASFIQRGLPRAVCNPWFIHGWVEDEPWNVMRR